MTGTEALNQLNATSAARVDTTPDAAKVAEFLATIPADATAAQMAPIAERLISEVKRGYYHFGKSVSLATQAAIADALLARA